MRKLSTGAVKLNMKKSRTIRSFEPDPDVGELLEKAVRAGLVISEIMNQSVRRAGPDVIEKMAAERLRAENDRLKVLHELSFDDPQLMMTWGAAA